MDIKVNFDNPDVTIDGFWEIKKLSEFEVLSSEYSIVTINEGYKKPIKFLVLRDDKIVGVAKADKDENYLTMEEAIEAKVSIIKQVYKQVYKENIKTFSFLLGANVETSIDSDEGDETFAKSGILEQILEQFDNKLSLLNKQYSSFVKSAKEELEKVKEEQKGKCSFDKGYYY